MRTLSVPFVTNKTGGGYQVCLIYEGRIMRDEIATRLHVEREGGLEKMFYTKKILKIDAMVKRGAPYMATLMRAGNGSISLGRIGERLRIQRNSPNEGLI